MGADAFDGVFGVGTACVEVGTNARGDMATRGEAEDAEPMRVDAPFRRARSHETNGALTVQSSVLAAG